MKKVGVIGCGLMGSGIAKNLIKHHFQVFVYDINPNAVHELVQEGAIATDSTGAIASEVDVLILSLPSPDLIKKIILDKTTGAIHLMKSGSFILDMSTNDVQLTKEMHEQAKKNGIEFFDCPLSGGPDGANNGTLTIMVGGSEEAFPAILPILEAVGEHITYIGESGTGQTVKLCHNMVVAGVITLLSEALLIGEKAGVPMKKLSTILQQGSAHTRVMDVFGVNIVDQTFDHVKFSLANMTKDIKLYHKLADSLQESTLASDSTNKLFQLANAQGKGHLDSSAVYEILNRTKELEID